MPRKPTPCPDCGQPTRGTYCRVHYLEHQKPYLRGDRIAAAQATRITKRRTFELKMNSFAVRLGVKSFKDFLVSEYSTKHIRDIAKEIGVKERTLTEWMHRFQIPLRSVSERNRKTYSKHNSLAKCKELARSKRREFFQSMTPEQRSEWARRAGAASEISRQKSNWVSNLERELYARLDQEHISYQRQYPIKNHKGVIVYIVDALVHPNIVVEANGYHWHTGKFEKRDSQRRNFIKACGYIVIEIWGHSHLENLDGAIATIKAYLSKQ